MICYQCGSKLGSGRYCLRCGADVSVYRKIVHISNTYYNAGLEKARLRDLSGAVEALSKSLQFDKKNINARNLLGLVYYEMGEVVEALSQWVISKNFQPGNNLADDYLAQLQEDRNQLDSMNQAIKKFNQALSHAKHDGKDLAMIQLKRVIRQNPRFVKAYQLLALLYIDDEDYSHANRTLKRALKIDRGNTLCQKYANTIRGKLGKSRSGRDKEKEAQAHRTLLALDEEETDGDLNESIVPAYRERSGNFRVFLGVLAGIAIAVCMYQFVIVRTMNRNANTADNQTIAGYATKLADKELEIQTLTTQLEDLQTEQETLNGRLSAYTDTSEGVLTQYDSLLTAVEIYMEEPIDNDLLAAAYAKINPDIVDSEVFASLYGVIEQYVTVDLVEEIFDQGMQQFDTAYYVNAIPLFEECLSLNADYDPAIYYLGLSYEKRNQPDDARKCFEDIVNNYPDSRYYGEAGTKVSEYEAGEAAENGIDEAEEDAD